jgi:hypothetical protein
MEQLVSFEDVFVCFQAFVTSAAFVSCFVLFVSFLIDDLQGFTAANAVIQGRRGCVMLAAAYTTVVASRRRLSFSTCARIGTVPSL